MTEAKAEQVNFCGIITSSRKMKDLFEVVKRVARTDSSVLLRGESGTGKELFAKAIHSISPRKQSSFNV
ncbi:MAG: sigma 54-interacting transcriptional regulator [Oligoflexales bacterium]